MEELLVVVIGKMIVLCAGIATRYCFFALTGRKKSLKFLTDGVEEGQDMEKEFAQGVYNGIVGAISLFAVTVVIVGLIF